MAARLPLAILFVVLLSCQPSWLHLTHARLPRALHRRSVPGQQQCPTGLLASWSHPNKRLSTRAKESQLQLQPSSTPCGAQTGSASGWRHPHAHPCQPFTWRRHPTSSKWDNPGALSVIAIDLWLLSASHTIYATRSHGIRAVAATSSDCSVLSMYFIFRL
jgi:hypothetical protein